MEQYNTKLGKMFLADSIEFLANSDEKIDVIITDPPYGINIDYEGTFDDTFENWCQLMHEWLPLAISRTTKGVIFPPGGLEQEIYLLKNFDAPKWRLCWYKGSQEQRSPVGFKHYEQVFIYGDSKSQCGDYFYASPGVFLRRLKHPCPKPLKFFEWLISKFSTEDDVVCDPFLGSGQLAVACEGLNRKWIGIEKNAGFFEICKDQVKIFNTFNSIFN